MFGLMEWIGSKMVDERAIRAESFALGGRHLGEVLTGARVELAADGKTAAQRALLTAVIRRQKRLERHPKSAGSRKSARGAS